MKRIILSAMVLLLGACMHKDNVQPEQNINFPAAYVVNGESSTLSVINLATNEVTHLIQLTDDSGSAHSGGHNSGGFLSYPHHIYLNPSKTQLVVAAPGMDLSGGHSGTVTHKDGGKVAVLDAVKGINIKIIETPLMNHNATFSPDGKEIWTSQSDVAGKVGTAPPAHIVSEVPNANVGVMLGVTVTVNVAVVAHCPAAGVKV